MQLGFSARGTASSGTVTIKYDDGKEVAVSGTVADGIDAEIARAYFGAHPKGEVTARGTVTTTVEIG
jgi:hypothetical protein